MKIVVDDKIPYIRPSLEKMGVDVVYKNGSGIGPDDVRDADALVVRTRTRCDARLLEGSRIRYVATATIGFDHIDVDYLDSKGIAWMNCPGCNAGSVEQYLRSCLLLLEREHGLCLQQTTLGVVGCGHVGSRIVRMARELGIEVLVCDPFLPQEGLVDRAVIESCSDIITYHVPLTREGTHPTFHLCHEGSFGRMRRHPLIINTSRGEVVDNQALLQALQDGLVRDAIIDTWEHEPQISLPLLERVMIGTPHIAGYSADGKVNADNMVIDGLCRFFSLPHPGRVEAPSLPSAFRYTGDPLQLYDPRTDSRALKSHPDWFERLRGDYPLRREHADRFCQ